VLRRHTQLPCLPHETYSKDTVKKGDASGHSTPEIVSVRVHKGKSNKSKVVRSFCVPQPVGCIDLQGASNDCTVVCRRSIRSTLDTKIRLRLKEQASIKLIIVIGIQGTHIKLCTWTHRVSALLCSVCIDLSQPNGIEAHITLTNHGWQQQSSDPEGRPHHIHHGRSESVVYSGRCKIRAASVSNPACGSKFFP